MTICLVRSFRSGKVRLPSEWLMGHDVLALNHFPLLLCLGSSPLIALFLCRPVSRTNTDQDCCPLLVHESTHTTRSWINWQSSVKLVSFEEMPRTSKALTNSSSPLSRRPHFLRLDEALCCWLRSYLLTYIP